MRYLNTNKSAILFKRVKKRERELLLLRCPFCIFFYINHLILKSMPPLLDKILILWIPYYNNVINEEQNTHFPFVIIYTQHSLLYSNKAVNITYTKSNNIYCDFQQVEHNYFPITNCLSTYQDVQQINQYMITQW